ncbi:MAG: OmpH family outer membrane protein [Octadecabacter sp.]|nr:OmpH family outer membrane protein [Octadecabacter sp.]
MALRILPLAVIISAGTTLSAGAQTGSGDVPVSPPIAETTEQGQAIAQTTEAPAPGVGGILVLDQDGLLRGSSFGQRIQGELEAASQALAAENRRIEAQLSAEELDLTERRATMSPEEFRPLAEEFDERVEAIRAAQEAKSRDLTDQAEAAQARFFEMAFPILLDIVQSRGASVLMDNRAVLLSAETVDITALATARINAQLGDGGPEPLIAIDGRADALPTPEPEDSP